MEVPYARYPRRDHEQVAAVDRRLRLKERQEEAGKEAIVLGRVLGKVGRRPMLLLLLLLLLRAGRRRDSSASIEAVDRNASRWKCRGGQERRHRR